MDTGLEERRAASLVMAQTVLTRVLKGTDLTHAMDPDNGAYLLVTYPGGYLHYDYFNGWVRAHVTHGRSAVYSLCLHQGSSATWETEHGSVRRIKKLIEDAGLKRGAKTLT